MDKNPCGDRFFKLSRFGLKRHVLFYDQAKRTIGIRSKRNKDETRPVRKNEYRMQRKEE